MNNRKLIKVNIDHWECIGGYVLIHVVNWDFISTDFNCCLFIPTDYPIDLFFELLESKSFFLDPTVRFIYINGERFLLYNFCPFV